MYTDKKTDKRNPYDYGNLFPRNCGPEVLVTRRTIAPS